MNKLQKIMINLVAVHGLSCGLLVSSYDQFPLSGEYVPTNSWGSPSTKEQVRTLTMQIEREMGNIIHNIMSQNQLKQLSQLRQLLQDVRSLYEKYAN